MARPVKWTDIIGSRKNIISINPFWFKSIKASFWYILIMGLISWSEYSPVLENKQK